MKPYGSTIILKHGYAVAIFIFSTITIPLPARKGAGEKFPALPEIGRAYAFSLPKRIFPMRT